MKSVSDQLSAMGLSFGDLCEIEGVEGVCGVYDGSNSDEGLVARGAGGGRFAYHRRRVVRGWKSEGGPGLKRDGEDVIRCYYFRQVDPPADELPEGVEKAIDEGYARYLKELLEPMNEKDDGTNRRYREFLKDVARAILQAAKDK